MKSFQSLILVLLTFGIFVWSNNKHAVNGFSAPKIGRLSHSPASNSALSMVLATPPPDSAFSSSSESRRKLPKLRKIRAPKPKPPSSSNKKSDVSDGANQNKWEKAEKVEHQLLLAIEALQEAMTLERITVKNNNQQQPLSSPSSSSTSNSTASASVSASASNSVSGLLFPSIRECNAALATFGDGGELLRALRLFMKMRKAALLAKHFHGTMGWSWPVPSPTLVTYSTIMSRANRVGKPRVALRMWKLMQESPEFVYTPTAAAILTSSSTSTSVIRSEKNTIVPDIKAANILMNSFAKLADIASAQDLLKQMTFGNGTDVPKLEPNLVTYNTLLDACHKAGDLDAALHAMEQLEQSGLTPDAWSYTSLIATVARKPSTASGANDPSLAFGFLEEMNNRNIRPNGMTYSALIDACGRCKRCDLALQGLRIMLWQKASEQQALVAARLQDKGISNNNSNNNPGKYRGRLENYSLSNEVGAWTAAINALGKEGRLHAAMRLFFAMPNFGVQPNTVTCGCLTDSLLKNGRTADTLKILHYMDEHGITPSEVMYTSLMTSAGNLAQLERNPEQLVKRSSADEINKKEGKVATFAPHCGSIEVYTVLMKSLTEDAARRASTELSREEIQIANAHSLMKVFLVFQEMKEAGSQPDLACYNALLRACARAGDISRAQSVFQQLQEDSLEPNDTSWRQLLRAAGNAKRCDIVISTWKMAMDYSYDIKSHLGSNYQIRSSQWIPSTDSFSTMISALIRRASDPTLTTMDRRRLYQKVVIMYVRIISGNKDDDLGMHRIDAGELVEDSRAMLLVLEAVVSLEHLTPVDGSFPNAMKEKSRLRSLAARILDLDVLDGIAQNQRLSRSSFRSLTIAQSWADRTGLTAESLRP